MKHIIFAALALTSTVAPVSGKIGETSTQIEGGNGQAKMEGQVTYKRGAFTVVVTYHSGISVIEQISKTASPVKSFGDTFSDTETQAILAVYGEGQQWEEAGYEAWLRSDHKVAAKQLQSQVAPENSGFSEEEKDAFQRSQNLLFIDTDFVEKLKAAKQQQDAAKLQAERDNVAEAFGPIPATPTPAPLPTLGSIAEWSHPKPPYPAQARMSHIEGRGSVRVTTDGSGHVISAVIVQSVGSGLLDHNTTNYALQNWSGPPNSTTVVPVTYRLQ